MLDALAMYVCSKACASNASGCPPKNKVLSLPITCKVVAVSLLFERCQDNVLANKAEVDGGMSNGCAHSR